MKKRMMIMLISLAVFFGLIFGWKLFKGMMVQRYITATRSQTITVSTTTLHTMPWQSTQEAFGSTRAILGVNVTTELAGMVQTIYFKPGATVKKNDILVQLNADAEQGKLKALQAQAEIAKITYNRDKAQYAVHAVSKQTLDTDEYNLKNIVGQVDEQAAMVAKKTIRAPFDGRLGISAINPGQYLNVGDTVTTLQTVDPIYVDFYLPQRSLAKLAIGQPVTVTADAFAKKTFAGKITTIQPVIDSSTRNVEVEATIANPTHQLTPGMYVSLSITTGPPKKYLTLPQSAITFNPYGDLVYLVKKSDEDSDNPTLIAKQVFVKTGSTRGDQIAILGGLAAGDVVVTSGQLKLRNSSRIAIDNSVLPPNEAAPVVPNDHEG